MKRLFPGLDIFVDKLRPNWYLLCEKREIGLEGKIIEVIQYGTENIFIVRHGDSSIGHYFFEEIEPLQMIYWWKLRKWLNP